MKTNPRSLVKPAAQVPPEPLRQEGPPIGHRIPRTFVARFTKSPARSARKGLGCVGLHMQADLLFKTKAIYAYTSEHKDDLKFPEAQIITVVEKENADWYIGAYEDVNGELQLGLLPINYIERYEPASPQSMPSAYKARAGNSVRPSQNPLIGVSR
jgi:hypothetical protein